MKGYYDRFAGSCLLQRLVAAPRLIEGAPFSAHQIEQRNPVARAKQIRHETPRHEDGRRAEARNPSIAKTMPPEGPPSVVAVPSESTAKAR